MSEENIVKWQKTNDPILLGQLVKEYNRLVHSQFPRYYGNLPQKTLESYAKKFLIDAFRTYDPKKAKITTHIVNNLQRLHRVNYNTSSVLHLSEELQRNVNVFKNAKEYLTDKYGREPNYDELSDYLGWPTSKVGRLDKNLHKEVLGSTMELSPIAYESDDPRLDYIYHDLDPVDKLIFQHKIGYQGAPVLASQDIARKTKLSNAAISFRANKIADLLKKTYNI